MTAQVQPIRAVREAGKWVGVATWQGQEFRCPHQHRTTMAARRCEALPLMVRAHRAGR